MLVILTFVGNVAVIDSAITPRLVSLLSHPKNEIRSPALRTIGKYKDVIVFEFLLLYAIYHI